MLDLYLVITPVFSILTILSLVALKKALSSPYIKDTKAYAPLLHTQTTIRITDQVNQPSQYLKTFCFMLKTYTIAQILFGNRSALKIPFLLTISITSILCYLVPSMYAFCFIGATVTIIYATGCILGTKQEQATTKITDQQKSINQIFNEIKNINLVGSSAKKIQMTETEKFRQVNESRKLEVLLTFIAIIVYLVMIGVTFKNYYNIELRAMMIGICINLVLDSFLIRPLVYSIISYPLSRLQLVHNFIQKQEIIVEILTKKRVKQIIDSSKLKRIQSPLKLFREKQQTDENKQNVFNIKSELRKIKLQKSSLPPLATTPLSLKKKQGPQNGDCSLVSLFNSGQKNKRNYGNLSFDLQKTFQQKCQQDCQQRQGRQNVIKKQKMRRNSNLIMVNPDSSKIKQFSQIDVQNQEEEDEKENEKSQKDNQSINQNRSHKNSDVLKFTLNNTIEENDFQNQEQEQRHNTQEDQNSDKYPSINQSKKNGLLQIRQDRGGEDLQEIDLNSPQRRNKRMSKGQDQIMNSEAKPKKKKYKKFSMDANKRVIKHSTGDPYLQDQTKMLDFQLKTKKNLQSGMLSRKTQINQSKLINSVRRVKNTKDPIVRQNDQNQLPSFQIQDL